MKPFRPPTAEGVQYSEHLGRCTPCVEAPVGRTGCARGAELLRAYRRSLSRVYPPIIDAIKRRSPQ